MSRIVISGYYGFGNVGDEAVLAGMLTTFRRLRIEAEVTVLSADPERTMREHAGVESIHRYRLPQVIRAMRRADLVVSGGGSLFQDVTSAISPYYYLSVLRLARLLRRKTMIYAQGVGPLVREGTKRAVARAMHRAHLITVRDADSKSLLESIGVTKPVHLSADPSFLVEPDLAAADRLLAEHGLTSGELIGVSLRPWKEPDGWLAEAARGIRQAADRLSANLALIPMQRPEDDSSCEQVEGGVLIRHSGEPGLVKGLIARCGLVAGMRLHSLIFAASSAVPFVPIIYDPKVASFAAVAGQSRGVELQALTSTAIAEEVVNAWRNRPPAEALRRKAEEMTRLALQSGRLAKELIDGT